MTKILVIEDEVSVRENLVDLLEASDYEVICAENGFLGAVWAFEHIPDLIVCDVMMPEVNGHEVLEALRQNPATATIPFIFLTAMADIQSIRKGMELGADDYLTKPFESIDLLKAIEVKLARKAVMEKTYTKDGSNEALSKVLIAIHMLKKLEEGNQKNQSLDLLGNVCFSEIKLIHSMPGLNELLTPDEMSLFNRLREAGSAKAF
jgi:two-component system, OmpR family, alkaline phosphatase synthesis response regulator PhoP